MIENKVQYTPIPRELAEFLTNNGYQEDRVTAEGTPRSAYRLAEPEIPLKGFSVTVVGINDEIQIRATLENDAPLMFGGQKRAICYAITEIEFFHYRTEWKWLIQQALEKMSLSLFLPLFNLHKADQNGHLVIK